MKQAILGVLILFGLAIGYFDATTCVPIPESQPARFAFAFLLDRAPWQQPP
jgi:hypothetical protein